MNHAEFIAQVQLLNVNLLAGRRIEASSFITELEARVCSMPVEKFAKVISWMVPRFQGSRLPTLADFMTSVKAVEAGVPPDKPMNAAAKLYLDRRQEEAEKRKRMEAARDKADQYLAGLSEEERAAMKAEIEKEPRVAGLAEPWRTDVVKIEMRLRAMKALGLEE